MNTPIRYQAIEIFPFPRKAMFYRIVSYSDKFWFNFLKNDFVRVIFSGSKMLLIQTSDITLGRKFVVKFSMKMQASTFIVLYDIS